MTKLPRRDYANLIKKVDTERRKAIEDQEKATWPDASMSKDNFARWVGRQHFLVDKGITRVFYFPLGAPDDEVRLLEVNELAMLPENAPVVAIDFFPDIEGIGYSLLVADVTLSQFAGISDGSVKLPSGWILEGSQEVTPTSDE